jgi:small subunit ribosomal protein S20
MANHASALKRSRQNQERRLRNMAYRSKAKTAIKKFLKAADEKSADAGTLLSQAASYMNKAVSKGVYHKNTASRTISRLSKKIAVA